MLRLLNISELVESSYSELQSPFIKTTFSNAYKTEIAVPV